MVLLTLVAMVGVWLAGCTSLGDIAGNSTDFGNAKIMGTVVDASGKPSAGTLVKLVPQKHDGSGEVAFPADTTDASGAYSLPASDTGVYNVEGVQPAHGTRMIRLGARSSKTAGLAMDTMRAVGRVRVLLADSLSKAGSRIVIQGTTYAATLTAADATAGFIDIDSLPAQKIPPVLYSAVPGISITKTIYDNIVVESGSTVIVDKQFSVAPSRMVVVDTNTDLQPVIDGLGAGDTLALQSGTYQVATIMISARGNSVRPVVIKAASGGHPVLRASAAGMNLVNMQGAAFLTIDGLEFDSTAGGDDVIKIFGDEISHDITIANCSIHDFGGRAVNSQGPQYNISIIRCHIYNSAGPNSGGINVNSLDINGVKTNPHPGAIDNNWMHDIGDSASVSPAIVMYQGCHSMSVRNNVIYRATPGGIVFFGYGGANGDESKSSVIEGNLISGSNEAIGVYGDAIARNNIVIASTYALFSNAYLGVAPANIRVYNNTFYGCERLNITEWDSAKVCVFANNAVFATTQPFVLAGGNYYGNVSDQMFPGFTQSTAADIFTDTAANDFYQKSGSLLIGKGLGPDISSGDFNGTKRDAFPDVGAYEYTVSSNPGWKITEGFKE
jgi:hypothetical protein